jgi:hypothetical protein
MASSATGDAIRRFALENERGMPTFFHGSTVVRTSILGVKFIKISGCLLFDLGFRCHIQEHGYGRFASICRPWPCPRRLVNLNPAL